MEEWFQNWFDADYALLYSHRDEEEAERAVRTLLKIAPSLAHGPLLDLGCGSGRHLQAMRRINPLAFGLDLSPQLLSLAPSALRPHLIRGDMRHLPIQRGTLAGICLWFTPFGYFDDAQNYRLMGRMAELLLPGGILLLDYFNPHHLRANLAPSDVVERDGLNVLSRRSLEDGRLVKRMTITRLKDGIIREAVESIRLYEPEELTAMAMEHGLSLFQTLGDYGGEPYSPEHSSRWIALFVDPRRDRQA